MNISNQYGSAITEFLIALPTLVIIFGLFSLVGKLSDVESAAQQGARYQAWEFALTGAGNNNTQDLKAEVHQRVLNETSFIESDIQSVNTDEDPSRYLWGMYSPESGITREAIIGFDEEGYDNEVTSSNPGLRAYALQWDVPGLDPIGIDDVDRDGLYNAKVDFAINNVRWLKFDGQANCGNGSRDSYLACLERNNAVLTDDWSAASPDVVVSRVQELNPGLFLWEPFTEVLETVHDIPFLIPTPGFDIYEPFEDLNHIDRAAGFVLPDVIPSRRLGFYEDEDLSEELD